jgi:hypothetical protein
MTMKPRYGALALPTLATGLFLCTGCGPANEGALKGESKVVPQRADMPNLKGYGDLLQYKMQEAKEKAKAKNAPKKTQ